MEFLTTGLKNTITAFGFVSLRNFILTYASFVILRRPTDKIETLFDITLDYQHFKAFIYLVGFDVIKCYLVKLCGYKEIGRLIFIYYVIYTTILVFLQLAYCGCLIEKMLNEKMGSDLNPCNILHGIILYLLVERYVNGEINFFKFFYRNINNFMDLISFTKVLYETPRRPLDEVLRENGYGMEVIQREGIKITTYEDGEYQLLVNEE
uniref:Bestrophin homolog n=1 Tax=Parastrongyloides trichosuri TaxID=131310 RepID=A0A0N4ZBG7_PARTI